MRPSRLTQFVCDLFDGVLQRQVRLHLSKGSHGGEAGLVGVIHRTGGTKRWHVVGAIRHHHAPFDDAERAIICRAPFGIQVQTNTFDLSIFAERNPVFAEIGMPFTDGLHVSLAIIDQPHWPANLRAATAAAAPMKAERFCLPPKPPPNCSTRTVTWFAVTPNARAMFA